MKIRYIVPGDFDAMDNILNSNGMSGARDFPPTYLVADDCGEIVGGGGYQKIGNNVGWLGSVAVAKHRKRTGIGSAVVRANLRMAGERGLGSMWLETYFWNSKFYESLSFEGITPDLVPEQIRAWRTKKHCRFMVNTGCVSSSELSKVA